VHVKWICGSNDHGSPCRVYIILDGEAEEVWNPEDYRSETENCKRRDDLPLVGTVRKGQQDSKSEPGGKVLGAARFTAIMVLFLIWKLIFAVLYFVPLPLIGSHLSMLRKEANKTVFKDYGGFRLTVWKCVLLIVTKFWERSPSSSAKRTGEFIVTWGGIQTCSSCPTNQWI
jgi:hypothetical protein